MEYLDYFISKFYDSLENFFNTFEFVSGKANVRVLIITIFYLFISSIATITHRFNFMDIKSSIIAVVLVAIINIVSKSQRMEIDKFRKSLKGDEK